MDCKLIVRKAKDGINYEAVIMDYCAGWYEREKGFGCTEYYAIDNLRQRLIVSICRAEEDLDLITYGRIEREV